MKKLLSLSLCLILLTFSVSGAVFADEDNPLTYPDYVNLPGSNNANAPLQMTVTTSLDKSLYLPGETATIGLAINNISKGDKNSNANLDLLFVMYDAQRNIINNYPNPITISNIDSFHIGNGEIKTLDSYLLSIPSDIAVDKIVLTYTVFDYGNFSGWKKTVVANGIITINVKLPLIDFSVNEASTDMGTISAKTDAVTITSGSAHKLDTLVNLEASPENGYRVKSWTVNGEKQESTSNQLQVKLDIDKNVVVEFELIPVPSTTEPPQPTTEAPQPTTEAPQQTTEATTETITEEEVALGDANTFNFDALFDGSEALETTTEVASDEVILIDEATPLADALPQTGQLPVEIFYGIGGLITAAGVFMKSKK